MTDSGYTIDDFKQIKRTDFTDDETFQHLGTNRTDKSYESTDKDDLHQENYGSVPATDGIDLEEFKGIHEIETEFSKLDEGYDFDNDDDADVRDYPKQRTSIYHPPLPKKRGPFYKRNKIKDKMKWDYDQFGLEFMEFPSEWTPEDEKIFYEKALPEYRANLKNRKANLAKMYSVPNTWKKKVYENIKIEEFGKARPDPLISGAVEKEFALKNIEEIGGI